MTDVQETDLNSFQNVLKVVKDFKAQLAAFPEVTNLESLLEENIGKIQANAVLQANGGLSETGFKTFIRESLNAKFATVVKALEGSISDNPGLQAKYKSISPSSLQRERDGAVKTSVSMVVADARTLLAKLARYDVDDTLLSEMETLANNYDEASSNKATAKGLSATSTSLLSELFKDTNKVLRDVDPIVKPMDTKMPDFFNAWFQARKKQGY